MAEAVVPAYETVWIDLNRVIIPSDARFHSPDELQSLAEDMTINGQLQEIVVVPIGDTYEVRAGVGRVLAARQLGWERIRANRVTSANDFEKRRITFSENQERENVSPLYQASLLRDMMDARGIDQRTLAQELGKTETLISQYLSLTKLAPELLQEFHNMKLTLRQLLQIRRLPTIDAQRRVGHACVDKNLSTKETQALVESLLQGQDGSKGPAEGRPVSWVGHEIRIHRNYRPQQESLEEYTQWLREALVRFQKQNPSNKKLRKAGRLAALPETGKKALDRIRQE